MSLEQEVCRRVFDHHSVLKGRLSQELLVLSKKENLTKETVAALIRVIDGEIESCSDKMVSDYQRVLKAQK
jgi:hypothetical protein